VSALQPSTLPLRRLLHAGLHAGCCPTRSVTAAAAKGFVPPPDSALRPVVRRHTAPAPTAKLTPNCHCHSQRSHCSGSIDGGVMRLRVLRRTARARLCLCRRLCPAPECVTLDRIVTHHSLRLSRIKSQVAFCPVSMFDLFTYLWSCATAQQQQLWCAASAHPLVLLVLCPL
jgi:hypothetical protein